MTDILVLTIVMFSVAAVAGFVFGRFVGRLD
jgi:hypothetical protein